MKKFDLSKDRIAEVIKYTQTCHVRTDFDFLATHLGAKPGKIHVVLGVAGGGKSTTRNSLIVDYLGNNPGKKVLLWLSEESYDDFEKDLARNPEMLKWMDKIIVFSEQNHVECFQTIEMAREKFKSSIYDSGCTFLLFDNITTSKLYGSTFSKQESFIEYLKPVIEESNVPCFIFAHTGAHIKAGHKCIIDQNDVRGSKSLTNISEFLYVLQTISANGNTYSTIKNVKHRGTDIGHKLFIFDYSVEHRIYRRSNALDIDKFNLLYGEQDDPTRVNKKNGRGKSR